MRTLNDFYTFFINAIEFGQIERCETPVRDTFVARVVLDGRIFYYAILESHFGTHHFILDVLPQDSDEHFTFSSSDYDEDEAFAFEFINNYFVG